MNRLKNKKGFSLIELVIVIAIMVALVAVMAPSFVKYVAKARDAAITEASEECITFVKANFGLTLTGEGCIRIGVDRTTRLITLTFQADEKNEGANTLNYENETGGTGVEAFKHDIGFKDGVNTNSDLAYLIRIKADDVANHPELELTVEETRLNGEGE